MKPIMVDKLAGTWFVMRIYCFIKAIPPALILLKRLATVSQQLQHWHRLHMSPFLCIPSNTGLPQVRKWWKKFFKVRNKSGNFIFCQGRLTFWRKVRENWNNLTRHSRLKEMFGVTSISTTFFLNKEGKFVENVSILMNEWKGRL